MVEILKTLPAAYLVAIILAISFVLKALIDALLWFFKDYWTSRKNQTLKRDEALAANTTAIIKLQVQIEQLTQLLTLVPKIKADIDYAHEKIRFLQNGDK